MRATSNFKPCWYNIFHENVLHADVVVYTKQDHDVIINDYDVCLYLEQDLAGCVYVGRNLIGAKRETDSCPVHENIQIFSNQLLLLVT